MADEVNDEGPVEQPWKFAIGQAVKVNGVAGEVAWRRESVAGERDYQVGDAWVPEAEVEAA